MTGGVGCCGFFFCLQKIDDSRLALQVKHMNDETEPIRRELVAEVQALFCKGAVCY